MAIANLTPRPNSRIRPRDRRHRCFELSGRYQLDDSTWTLVHGVILTESGIPIAHAWLKREGWIFDAVRNESLREPDYCERFGAREVGTFSQREAAEKAADLGYWGPWVEYDSDVLVGGR